MALEQLIYCSKSTDLDPQEAVVRSTGWPVCNVQRAATSGYYEYRSRSDVSHIAMATATTRAKALSLYKQLLRGAEMMPTPNRRKFVVKKTRTEFKANKDLTDPDEIQFCLRLADTNLDTVLIQAEHLTNLMKDPTYHADI